MYKLFRMNGTRKFAVGTFDSIEDAQAAASKDVEWDGLRGSVKGDFYFGFRIEEIKVEASTKPEREGYKYAPRRRNYNNNEEIDDESPDAVLADYSEGRQRGKPNDAKPRDINDPDHFLNR